MKVTIDLEYEQVDAIVVDELKKQYSDLKQSLYGRRNGRNEFGVFSSDKKKDINLIKKQLSSLRRVLRWNMDVEDYRKWRDDQKNGD